MYASKVSQSIGLLPLLEFSVTDISKIYTYNESSGRLSLKRLHQFSSNRYQMWQAS